MYWAMQRIHSHKLQLAITGPMKLIDLHLQKLATKRIQEVLRIGNSDVVTWIYCSRRV